MATSSELLQVFTGFYKSPSICELCDMTRTTQKISKCSLLIENAKMYISYSAIDMPFIKNGGWPFDGFTSATPFVATLRAGDHLEGRHPGVAHVEFDNAVVETAAAELLGRHRAGGPQARARSGQLLPRESRRRNLDSRITRIMKATTTQSTTTTTTNMPTTITGCTVGSIRR